jgi:hypothetical protein
MDKTMREAERIWMNTNSPENYVDHDLPECPVCGEAGQWREHSHDEDCGRRCQGMKPAPCETCEARCDVCRERNVEKIRDGLCAECATQPEE